MRYILLVKKLKNASLSFCSTIIFQVSKVIAENEVDVSDNEVKEVAEMTRKLSTELSIEQVEVISDVKKNSKRPSSMSLREINQAVVLANRIENNKDKKASSSQALVKVDENDVQIVSEIIDMLDAVDNPDELELIAVMTKTASQDILSTENSEKIRFNAGDSNDIDENGNDDVMDDNDAEEIADLITDLGRRWKVNNHYSFSLYNYERNRISSQSNSDFEIKRIWNSDFKIKQI